MFASIFNQLGFSVRGASYSMPGSVEPKPDAVQAKDSSPQPEPECLWDLKAVASLLETKQGIAELLVCAFGLAEKLDTLLRRNYAFSQSVDWVNYAKLFTKIAAAANARAIDLEVELSKALSIMSLPTPRPENSHDAVSKFDFGHDAVSKFDFQVVRQVFTELVKSMDDAYYGINIFSCAPVIDQFGMLWLTRAHPMRKSIEEQVPKKNLEMLQHIQELLQQHDGISFDFGCLDQNALLLKSRKGLAKIIVFAINFSAVFARPTECSEPPFKYVHWARPVFIHWIKHTSDLAEKQLSFAQGSTPQPETVAAKIAPKIDEAMLILAISILRYLSSGSSLLLSGFTKVMGSESDNLLREYNIAGPLVLFWMFKHYPWLYFVGKYISSKSKSVNDYLLKIWDECLRLKYGTVEPRPSFPTERLLQVAISWMIFAESWEQFIQLFDFICSPKNERWFEKYILPRILSPADAPLARPAVIGPQSEADVVELRKEFSGEEAAKTLLANSILLAGCPFLPDSPSLPNCPPLNTDQFITFIGFKLYSLLDFDMQRLSMNQIPKIDYEAIAKRVDNWWLNNFHKFLAGSLPESSSSSDRGELKRLEPIIVEDLRLFWALWRKVNPKRNIMYEWFSHDWATRWIANYLLWKIENVCFDGQPISSTKDKQNTIRIAVVWMLHSSGLEEFNQILTCASHSGGLLLRRLEKEITNPSLSRHSFAQHPPSLHSLVTRVLNFKTLIRLVSSDNILQRMVYKEALAEKTGRLAALLWRDHSDFDPILNDLLSKPNLEWLHCAVV